MVLRDLCKTSAPSALNLLPAGIPGFPPAREWRL